MEAKKDEEEVERLKKEISLGGGGALKDAEGTGKKAVHSGGFFEIRKRKWRRRKMRKKWRGSRRRLVWRRRRFETSGRHWQENSAFWRNF
jgi:hypothetical protein